MFHRQDRPCLFPVIFYLTFLSMSYAYSLGTVCVVFVPGYYVLDPSSHPLAVVFVILIERRICVSQS